MSCYNNTCVRLFNCKNRFERLFWLKHTLDSYSIQDFFSIFFFSYQIQQVMRKTCNFTLFYHITHKKKIFVRYAFTSKTKWKILSVFNIWLEYKKRGFHGPSVVSKKSIGVLKRRFESKIHHTNTCKYFYNFFFSNLYAKDILTRKTWVVLMFSYVCIFLFSSSFFFFKICLYWCE